MSCEYCAGPKQKIPEASVRTWLLALRKPEYKKIIFTGGEPLLYKGIFEIIKRLKRPVEIYTNLCARTRIKTSKNTTYNISIHDETDIKIIKTWINAMKEIGRPFSLHRVKGHGGHIDLPGITEAEDQRKLKINKDPHFCNIKRTLFGPDAKRYPCCARMGEFEVGEGRYDGTYCREPKCLPCDLFGQRESDDNSG